MNRFIAALFVFALWTAGCLAYYSCAIQGQCLWSGDVVPVQAGAAQIETVPTAAKSNGEKATTAEARNQPATVIDGTDTSLSRTGVSSSDGSENSIDESLQPAGNSAAASGAASLLPSSSMTLTTGDNKILDYNSNIRLYKNSTRMRLPAEIRNYAVTLREYTTANPSQVIQITGFEDAKSEAAGLGKQRADFIAKLLRSAGINSQQLTTMGKVSSLQFDSAGYTSSAIRFDMVSPSATPNESSAQASITDALSNAAVQVRTVESKDIAAATENTVSTTASSTLEKEVVKPNRTSLAGYRAFFDSVDNGVLKPSSALKMYLDQNLGMMGNGNKTLTAYVHSDTVGNRLDNYNYTVDVAKQLKRYLLNRGYTNSQISVIAKGETEPLPRDGRAAYSTNQRIEFILR